MDSSTPPTRTDNAVIMQYADCLRTAYVEMRQQRAHSTARRIAPKSEPLLWKFAVMLHSREVSPFEYVSWCFDRLLRRHDDVYVNMVCSEALLGRFMAEAVDREKELDVLVKLQAHAIRRREERGEALSKILLDETAQLSAAIRFAVAHSRGDTELAENFREDAEKQLMFQPHYKKLLGKFLPEDMK